MLFLKPEVHQLTGSATLKNHFVHNIVLLIAEHVGGKDTHIKKDTVP